MKAAVLHGREDMRYEETETPVPGEGEVLIQVRAAGICGSDIPRVNGDAARAYPIILGHEFSGIVAEVGSNVTGLVPGQRVTAAPLMPCMKCPDCMRGHYALCKQYTFIGSSVNGSFAEYVKVPKQNVVPFSAQVEFVQAAFFEPATVGLHGLYCADYRGGTEVAILGGGTIGIFTMQWAKLLGAQSVTVFDIRPEALELAQRLGADRVINTQAQGLEAALEATRGRGYDYVFETAGTNATMNLAFEIAANKARVCFIGTSSRDISFPWRLFEKMNRKEFQLTGSWMSYSAPFPGREWEMTAEYLGKGLLKFDPALVYRYFKLDQAAEAFELFKTPGAVKGKLMFEVGVNT